MRTLFAFAMLLVALPVAAQDDLSKIANDFFAVYDKFDLDAASEFMADDMVYEMPEHNLRVEGKSQILSNMKRDTAAWSDPEINDVISFTNGQYFIRVSKGSASTAGANLGLSVDTFEMPFNNVSILKIVDGKIVLKRDYFDYSEGYGKIAALNHQK